MNFLSAWLDGYITEQLYDLINLVKLKNNNQYLRALAYRLYENNGILKRNSVDDIVSKIDKDVRRQFRKLGIKIGRYHIYLPKMLKPKAVELRILLWEFYNELKHNQIPRSGLNFLNDNEYKFNKKFLLLCGFEKFNNYFIRVDILEKLFIKIIENSKNGKFKINSDMMNLLGCSKENFFSLIKIMDYKKDKNEENLFFYYKKRKDKKKMIFSKKNNSPFKKLEQLNLK